MSKLKCAKPVVPISLSKKPDNEKAQLFTPIRVQWGNMDDRNEGKDPTFYASMKKEFYSYKEQLDKLIAKEEKQAKKENPRLIIKQKKKVDPSSENPQLRQNKAAKNCQKSNQFTEKLVLSPTTKGFRDGFEPIFANPNSVQKQEQDLNDKLEPIFSPKNNSQNVSNELEMTIPEVRPQNTENCRTAELVLSQQKCTNNNLQIQALKSENYDIKQHNAMLEQKIEGLIANYLMMAQEFEKKQNLIVEQECMIEGLEKQRDEVVQRSDEERTQLQARIAELHDEKRELNVEKREIEEQMEKAEEQHIRQMNYYMNQLKLRYEENINELKQQIQILQNENDDPISPFESSSSQMQQLAKQFQQKMNILIDENYGLKNKISQLMAQVEKLELASDNYVKEIGLLEEREDRRNSSNHWEREEAMRGQIQELKQEIEKIIHQYEFKVMKLENQIEQCEKGQQQQVGDSFKMNKILKDQIEENQVQKSKNKQLTGQIQEINGKVQELQEQVEILRQDLELEKMKNSMVQEGDPLGNGRDGQASVYEKIQKMMARQEKLKALICEKNMQIKAKEEFIHKVLISKIDKPEDQAEFQYLLEKMSRLSGGEQ